MSYAIKINHIMPSVSGVKPLHTRMQDALQAAYSKHTPMEMEPVEVKEESKKQATKKGQKRVRQSTGSQTRSTKPKASTKKKTSCNSHVSELEEKDDAKDAADDDTSSVVSSSRTLDSALISTPEIAAGASALHAPATPLRQDNDEVMADDVQSVAPEPAEKESKKEPVVEPAMASPSASVSAVSWSESDAAVAGAMAAMCEVVIDFARARLTSTPTLECLATEVPLDVLADAANAEKLKRVLRALTPSKQRAASASSAVESESGLESDSLLPVLRRFLSGSSVLSHTAEPRTLLSPLGSHSHQWDEVDSEASTQPMSSFLPTFSHTEEDEELVQIHSNLSDAYLSGYNLPLLHTPVLPSPISHVE